MIKHILPFLFLLAPAFAAQDCPSLAKLELEGTTITRAEAVPAGGAVEGVKTWPGLRAFCRVAGSISYAQVKAALARGFAELGTGSSREGR